MMSQELSKARAYEEKEGDKVPSEQRPLFHLSPRIGWMNDPNGFSFYKGKYHLFYQYYPYDKKWGPMHWGHAVSGDLLSWEYLPAAMAPDTEADRGGCFSGSAAELPDGRQLLLYTGVIPQGNDYVQMQCAAIGDGTNYEKCQNNPLITQSQVPSFSNHHDFRDPKIFSEKDGGYGLVAVDCMENRLGRVLYYRSPDGLDWKFRSILSENDGTFGRMWECPDFFELDGTHVLLVSPMDMRTTETYYSGNGTVCMIGTFSESDGTFHAEQDQPIDCGIDFYAAQTMIAPDGRRIMTAWMQNWDTISYVGETLPWCGQMITPRELHVKDGRLIQQPVREIEALRRETVHYEKQRISEKTTLEGVSGRTAELLIEIEPAEEGSFSSFEIRLAEKDKTYTSLIFDPLQSMFSFNRSFSGTVRNVAHERHCRVPDRNGHLSLRIILDRFSCEVFLNGGEQTLSHVLYTDADAEGISFSAKGCADLTITCFRLSR